MDAAEVIIADAPRRSRYEARMGRRLAGFAAYQKTRHVIIFTHTVVLTAFEGRRIGTRLVREALDHVRARGRYRVLPQCPFVRGFIAQHQEYADLVYRAPRSTAGG